MDEADVVALSLSLSLFLYLSLSPSLSLSPWRNLCLARKSPFSACSGGRFAYLSMKREKKARDAELIFIIDIIAKGIQSDSMDVTLG